MIHDNDISPVIKGVSPDEPTVINARGGKQARSLYAFHLLDADAMLAIARVMKEDAGKYERDNWRKIDAEEHFNHLAIHWYAWLNAQVIMSGMGYTTLMAVRILIYIGCLLS